MHKLSMKHKPGSILESMTDTKVGSKKVSGYCIIRMHFHDGQNF